MNQQFQIGDVVKLKSGGPLMTIVKTFSGDEGISYRCEWFDGDQKNQHATFPPASLMYPGDAGSSYAVG